MEKKTPKKHVHKHYMSRKPRSLDTLLFIHNKNRSNSVVIEAINDDESYAELTEREMEELYKLIEELENKDEKDN